MSNNQGELIMKLNLSKLILAAGISIGIISLQNQSK